MVDQQLFLTIIGTWIAAFSVAIPLVYYIVNIRNLWKNRQAQLFMSIYGHFHRPMFWEQYAEIVYLSEWDDYRDFWKRYGPTKKGDFAQWMSFGTYFTGIAVLVKKKLIDINLVDDLVGDYIIWIWRKLNPILIDITESTGNQPKAAYWIDYLYEEIMKKRKFDKMFITAKK
ncbi:MAG: hypothetical protein PVJ38_06525 [Candidatus Bathyarchaeota archaeon]|jgi:hypothetical protein